MRRALFALHAEQKQSIINKALCTNSRRFRSAGDGFYRNFSQKGGVSMSFEAIKGISDAEVLGVGLIIVLFHIDVLLFII